MRTPEHIERQNAFFRQLLFLGLLIVMALIIFGKLSSLLGAFLGASTLYILFRRTMFYLVEKREWKKWIASLTIVVFVSLVFIGALFGIFELIVSEIQNINTNTLIEKGNEMLNKVNSMLGLNLLSSSMLDKVAPILTRGTGILINATYQFTVSIIFMILILYFMLVNGRKMEADIKCYMPFKGRSRDILVKDTASIIYSNAIVIPVIMLSQGLVAVLVYWLFGLENVALWAFVTAICGLIPMVGTAIVSVPLGINFILQGGLWQGLGLIMCGVIIIANVDNLIRILFNKKVTDVHPLVVILGVLIGIPVFGFWGIIFGPLLISIFLLLIKIYYMEYNLFSKEDLEEREACGSSLSKSSFWSKIKKSNK